MIIEVLRGIQTMRGRKASLALPTFPLFVAHVLIEAMTSAFLILSSFRQGVTQRMY